jgi:hypothetical protein
MTYRYYYISRQNKAVYVHLNQKPEIPDLFEFLGGTDNPSVKMAASAFLGGVSGHTITDYTDPDRNI